MPRGSALADGTPRRVVHLAGIAGWCYLRCLCTAVARRECAGNYPRAHPMHAPAGVRPLVCNAPSWDWNRDRWVAPEGTHV